LAVDTIANPTDSKPSSLGDSVSTFFTMAETGAYAYLAPNSSNGVHVIMNSMQLPHFGFFHVLILDSFDI
jgi:hypothetical protein